MASFDDLDPRTPVIVGVGQSAERVDAADYQRMSAVDLAARAAERALADAGVPASAVDTVVGVRQFEISIPGATAPLGRADNYPRAVATRLGAAPLRAVLEVSGGQAPQHLINEFSAAVVRGEAATVLLVGSEAIATTRLLGRAVDRPDFTETVGGQLEDRGYGLEGLVDRRATQHGLVDAASQYALFENARRARLKLSRDDYATSMGRLFEPFTEVAASNSFAAAPVERSAAEMVTPTERNRMIADPYPRFLVARDQVNQGAAVVLTSVGTARHLGIPRSSWVFLRGHADLRERNLFDRSDLSSSPAAGMAVRRALEMAEVTLDDVATFDLYSCFPIAVFNVCDQTGLDPQDPRGLTLTGGLPFFGGPGNNYSMHGIAETVLRARSTPGSVGLVGANGGTLSKYSVGVYTTTPSPWRARSNADLQRDIDAWPAVERVTHPHGWATIETFTITSDRQGKRMGIVIGRLECDNRRFVARGIDGDDALLDLLASEEPIGARIFVRASGPGNRVALDDAAIERLMPTPSLVLRDRYDNIVTERVDRRLEIIINRPESRNSVNPPTSDELDHALNAFFADRDLWVAIIAGAGTEAFSAGNDLIWTAQGKPIWVPMSGFGGITSRRDMDKPVIAAVNGYAMGGGFEIALACHLIVADTTAQFALSEARVGLVAGAGGLVRLPNALPPKLATEMIMTGRRLRAQEALHHGLINRVVDSGTALEGARRLAEEILGSSPTSVRTSLQMLNKIDEIASTADAVDRDFAEIDDLLVSEDTAEGLAAFAAKRPPQWRNR